ncbi:hypothetical protein MauCBS54593_000262 [Microsporum audouinii]
MSSQDTKAKPDNQTNLDKRVDALVCQYQGIKTPSTIIHLSKTPGYRELFNHVFEHHICLIRSRSQDLEDARITVYDKALLILTNNGSSLSHFGAIELFKDEVLGIRKESDMGKLDALFSKNIALRAILGHVTGWRKDARFEIMASGAESKETAQQKQAASDPLTPPSGASRRELDDRLTSMLKTFATAQFEHNSLSGIKNHAKYRAALFLSDSVENLLGHLRDHDPTHYMVPVLKQTFDMAQREIVEMDGVKKRSFDMYDKEPLDRPHSRRRPSTPAAKGSGSRRRRRGQADCYRP